MVPTIYDKTNMNNRDNIVRNIDNNNKTCTSNNYRGFNDQFDN